MKKVLTIYRLDWMENISAQNSNKAQLPGTQTAKALTSQTNM